MTSIDSCLILIFFFFNDFIIYSELSLVPSHVCIFLYFFTLREFLGLGQKCCKYNVGVVGVPCGFRFSRSHCCIGASAASIRATAQFNCSNTETTHMKISARPHMHLHLHIERNHRSYDTLQHIHELNNMFSISLFEGSVYFLISLSAILIIV